MATATATPKMYEGTVKVLSEGGITVLSFTHGNRAEVYGMRSKDALRVASQIEGSIARAKTKSAKVASKPALTNASKGAKKGAKKGGKC